MLPDGRRASCRLPERCLVIKEAGGDAVREIELRFRSGGAVITTLGAGPDGKVYGSTAHPMHFFRYDAVLREVCDLGAIKAIGGGNICALAAQGRHLVGPAYPWGDFYLYDPDQPFVPEDPVEPNPRVLARFERHITRPRACLAHPDGVHVISAGFMDYGHVGGGLGIVNLETGEQTLLTHEQVVPRHSTHALKALLSGDLVGGTSVHAPGGGHATEPEGLVYILDWARREVVFQTVPVPGAPEVFSLEVGADGMVCGLATGALFFVFDPVARQVTERRDLSALGELVRPALVRGPDGVIYGVLSKTVFRVEPSDHRITVIAESPVPITAGLAVLDGKIYFSSRGSLWSCRL